MYKQDAIIPELCEILGNLGEVETEIEQDPGFKKLLKKKK